MSTQSHACLIVALALCGFSVHADVNRGAEPVFVVEQLAPDVYAAVVTRSPPAYAFANSLVVIGAEGVLVVDTQQSPTAARALINEIARLTPQPVRWVVNTHWHGDHVNGNQAYAQAFAGVQFIAHATLVEDLRVQGAARRADELASLPVSIEQRREWLATGIGPAGTPLADADRTNVARSLALREAYLEELRRIDPPPPTRVVDKRLELSVGAHRVVLLHLGPAHTRGDLVVILPTLGLVAVGDLLEAGMPYFDDSFPAGWRRALDQIAELNPAVIVPSHGPVQHDRALLDDTRALLDAIIAAANSTDPALDPVARLWEERYGVSARVFNAGARSAIERTR